ncbi:hypothetical protein Pint_20463 [Pistacia integerrima]|uniref:Uncharacterized protein n=1 Tax=Pistacia integerrima TaxID=434235 RepID=A0ACC0XBA0_9ROSI|nr:hypothetical protein Pint_20463 [Pistacia integerrima]
MGNKLSTTRSKLKPSDHVCGPRVGGLYYHHGIYVGDDMVIHLMAPADKAPGKKVPAKKGNSSSPCQKCGYNPDTDDGIIKTCLDCFLSGSELYIYQYSCACNSPHEVIRIATEFLQGKRHFGDYSFIFNNCKDFAYYCKTKN